MSCGMGIRSRERYIKQYPEDGSVCQLHTEETDKCVVNDECCESFLQGYAGVVKDLKSNLMCDHFLVGHTVVQQLMLLQEGQEGC